MRMFFAFFFACFLVVQPVLARASKQEQFPFTARVKASHVNIRAGQSNNYESLLEVNADSELVVVGKSYSWYKVRLPENARMFVKAEYVKVLTPQVGEVTGDRVNIRARANTDATIIGQLVRGDQFFIKETIADKGGWLWVRPVAKAQGWVHEGFVEFKSRQMPAQLFADPKDAVAKARAEKEAAERRRAEKFAALKAVTADQYEAQGVLAIAEEGVGSYKLMGGVKGETCIAYVEGSSSMLGGFVGARVVVRGAARDETSRGAALMTVVRINLAL